MTRWLLVGVAHGNQRAESGNATKRKALTREYRALSIMAWKSGDNRAKVNEGIKRATGGPIVFRESSARESESG